LLIEFCAPSGSGKTTVMRAWRRAAEASGVKVRGFKDLSFLARRKLIAQAFLRKHRSFPENSFEAFCRDHCDLDMVEFSRLLIKNLVQYAHWRREDSDGIVLFDEFVTHQFLRLCARSHSRPEALLEGYLQRMPRVDAVVTLSVPIEVSFARIEKRDAAKTVFFGDRPLEQVPEVLKRVNRACDLITEGAERAGIHVIRCDGQAAPEDNVRRITEALAAIRSPALAS
jgi:thymidylate kinase